MTNDAVQKGLKDYGKYEKGNKLGYGEFDQWLKNKCLAEKDKNESTDIIPEKKSGFYTTILPQIRQLSTDVMHAAYYFVDPNKKVNNFEIFGLDIMVDEDMKCYLIEVNTNPCL